MTRAFLKMILKNEIKWKCMTNPKNKEGKKQESWVSKMQRPSPISLVRWTGHSKETIPLHIRLKRNFWKSSAFYGHGQVSHTRKKGQTITNQSHKMLIGGQNSHWGYHVPSMMNVLDFEVLNGSPGDKQTNKRPWRGVPTSKWNEISKGKSKSSGPGWRFGQSQKHA